jgi:hypothetical protein
VGHISILQGQRCLNVMSYRFPQLDDYLQTNNVVAIAYGMTKWSSTYTLWSDVNTPSWCSFQGVTSGTVMGNANFNNVISIDISRLSLTG